MAWTEQLPSGNWRALYRDAAGKRRSAGTFPHKRKALLEASAAEEKASRLRGEDRTWSEWYPVWWGSRTISSATKRAERSLIQNHVEPYWGDTFLTEIRRFDIKAWASGLVEDLPKASSAKRAVAAFSSSMSAAADAEIIPVNPGLRLGISFDEPEVVRYFERFEVARFLEEARNEVDRVIIAVLVGCGLRWSEMTALRGRNVDITRRKLRVAEAHDAVTRELKVPKGRAARTVPIPGWVAEELSLLLPTRGGNEFVFGPMHSSDWRRSVWLKLETGGRIHDLRHTYASWLLQDGVPLAEVSRLLGHSSVQVTERYAHLQRDARVEIVAGLVDPRIVS